MALFSDIIIVYNTLISKILLNSFINSYLYNNSSSAQGLLL